MQRPPKHNTQTNPSLPSTPALCPKHPSICHAGLIPDDNNKDDSNEPRPAFIDDINNESIANYSALARLPTKTLVLSTTTAQATSSSCCLTATYVFW
jgi:hypothetical protein